jgi:hypothetical protein
MYLLVMMEEGPEDDHLRLSGVALPKVRWSCFPDSIERRKTTFSGDRTTSHLNIRVSSSLQEIMDAPLRCNSLKCRQRLSDRAVVTTCRLVTRRLREAGRLTNLHSHIFCIPCSNALGLSSSADGVRVCPACDAQLANPDDAVATQLNPTEDYKTSVLSGLSPTIIMECCSRGLSFYQYQVTQEM